MAQEKYAYGHNTADAFADDDPLAELARIVGYDKPAPRPVTPDAYRAPAVVGEGPVAARQREPIFDLEDELLRAFERYDAPQLDPSASIPVRVPELVAPASLRVEPPVAAPRYDAPVSHVAAPAFDSFDDLADELELSVGGAGAVEADMRADAGHDTVREAGDVPEPVRRDPSFEPGAGYYDAARFAPFAEQPAQAYDLGHYSTENTDLAIDDAVAAFGPVAAERVTSASPVDEFKAAAHMEPDFSGFEAALAEDEFDLALDGLELDLSDLVLDEVVSAEPVVHAPVVAEARPHSGPAIVDALFRGAAPSAQQAAEPDELPFDAEQIAEADFTPDLLADLDVPEIPAEPVEAPVVARADTFDVDLDAEFAELLREEQPALSEPYREAPVATRSALPEIDDFSDFMNNDFNETMAAPLGADRTRPVIDPDSMEVVAPKGRRNLRGWLVGAVASIAVIAAGAGAYAWMSSGSIIGTRSGDGPPIIAASGDPIKVVPADPGGKTVPNQDKAVYDRVAGAGASQPTQKSLITSSEEPLDVVQRTLRPENFPPETEEDLAAMSNADARLQPDADAGKPAEAADAADANVSLRKVRTMIVRPDGTLVARDVAASDAPAPSAAALPASSSAQTPPAPEVAAAKPEAVAAPAAKAPVPVQRPAAQPVNVVGTVSSEGVVREAPAPQAPAEQQVAAVASKPLPAGTYVVQIASLPSAAEAERSYKSMSAKYAGIISGRGVDIKSADIPGKGTFYRVRIPAGAKADADAMCGRLKAAGASCIVTR